VPYKLSVDCYKAKVALDLAGKSPYNFFMIKKNMLPLLFLFSLLLFLSLQGCSSEQVKKSDSSNRITALRETLEKMKKNYESKDTEGFVSLFSPSFKDLARMKSDLPASFGQFKKASLEFRIDHMELEPSQGIIMIQWEGTWETAGSAEPVRGSGTALFKFSEAPAPLVIEINGSNPFMLPVRGKTPDAPKN